MKNLVSLLFASLLFSQTQSSVTQLTFNSPSPSSVVNVSASPIGNQGTTTYYYWVIAKYPIGNAAPSNPAFVTTASNSLTANNSVLVSWSSIIGAIGYDVIRSTSNNLPSSGAIAVITNTTNTSVNDVGNSLTNYVVNTMLPASKTMYLDNQNCVYPTMKTTNNSSCDNNVRNLGAKGDGVTDDTAILQGVINQRSAYLPNGTYIISSPLSLPVATLSGINLSCESPQTIIKFTGTGDAIEAYGIGNPYSGLTINNCTIDGSSSGNGSNGLRIRAFSNGTFNNIRIQNFTTGDCLLNEGANSNTFTNFSATSCINGIHNKGINWVGQNFSANANYFNGGVISYNSKWGVFEDYSYSAGGPNQNNRYTLIFELNGTGGVASGQIYFQACDICTIENSYLEFAPGNTIPYQIVIGSTTSDGIGNITATVNHPIISKNIFLTAGSVSTTIKFINTLSPSFIDNSEEGTPLNLIDIGTNGSNVRYVTAKRNLALAASNYLTGTDANGSLIIDNGSVSSILNAQASTIYGYGFNTITSLISNGVLNIRQNGTNSNIVDFLNTGGAIVGAIDQNSILTVTGGAQTRALGTGGSFAFRVLDHSGNSQFQIIDNSTSQYNGQMQWNFTGGGSFVSQGIPTATRLVTFQDANGIVPYQLTSVTSTSIGGSSLASGVCTSGTVSITNLTTSMQVNATPTTYPGDGIDWRAYTSTNGTATIKVCNTTTGAVTPTASTYVVRVIQ